MNIDNTVNIENDTEGKDIQDNIDEIIENNPVIARKKKIVKKKKVVAKKVEKTKTSEEKIEHEVYFGELNFQANEENIEEFFKDCGEVTQVKLLYRDDGRSRGRGFIKFKTLESANKAIEKNGTYMMERHIVVEFPKNKSFIKDKPPKFFMQMNKETNTPESMNVIVRNIPFEARENDLNEIFNSCGEIRNTRIIRNGDGSSKGFGFVDFNDVASAQRAIVKSGTEMNGREIIVAFSIPREHRKDADKFKSRIRGVKSLRKRTHIINKERKKNLKFGGSRVNKGFAKQEEKPVFNNPNFKGEVVDL